MRLTLTILLVSLALLFAGCDAADFFASDDGGPSAAQSTLEDVRPLIPNGLPRVLADIVLAGLAIFSAATARKKAVKEADGKLAAYDESEYTLEEAQAMLKAMDELKKSGV